MIIIRQEGWLSESETDETNVKPPGGGSALAFVAAYR